MPPVAETVILPAPEQPTLVCVVVNVKAGGSVIVTVTEAVQPLLS